MLPDWQSPLCCFMPAGSSLQMVVLGVYSKVAQPFCFVHCEQQAPTDAVLSRCSKSLAAVLVSAMASRSVRIQVRQALMSRRRVDDPVSTTTKRSSQWDLNWC